MNVVSVVIPLVNEAGSIKELYAEIVKTFSEINQEYEVIFVNDGSTDNSQILLEEIALGDIEKRTRVIEFKKNFGKATAFDAGFSIAKGNIVITMDADLQDDPKEIPRFIEKVNEGYDVVSGWKIDRKDSLFKNQTSKVYNFFTSLFTGIWLHDHNCGFKAYRKEALEDLELYGQLHRYMPALIAANGYKAITEISVDHRKRTTGKTKYGPMRFLHGMLDLITVLFVTKYKSSPLHFFGVFSLLFISAGFIIGLYLSYLRIFQDAVIGSRPLLFLSILLIVVGIQIGGVGLLSEQITNVTKRRSRESITRKII
jgi:glycosyltransferase involved in cell wall biosynthesis